MRGGVGVGGLVSRVLMTNAVMSAMQGLPDLALQILLGPYLSFAFVFFSLTPYFYLYFAS